MELFNLRQKFEKFFFWLRIIGLWPKNASYEFNIYGFYSIVCVSLFIFAHVFFQTMTLFVVQLNLNVLSAALLVGGQLMLVTKVYIFLNHFPTINKLLATLDDPDFQPMNEAQNKIAEDDFKLWTVLFRVYHMVGHATATAWVLRPLGDGSYKEHVLPLFAWYPFDTTISPYYQIAYFYQIVGMFFIYNALVAIDALSVGFIIYIGTQCDMLCDKLKQVKNSVDLIKCVQRHRKIFLFFSDFSSFLGQIIFAQLFGSATTTALTLFKLSLTVPGTTDYYVSALTAFLCTLEIFMYCWFGNEVQVRSSHIAVAIFESDWIGTSPQFQKLLLIFAMRTQQPMTLTAALNLFPLSLTTFLTIMRTSWSYFTLLHQMKNK